MFYNPRARTHCETDVSHAPCSLLIYFSLYPFLIFSLSHRRYVTPYGKLTNSQLTFLMAWVKVFRVIPEFLRKNFRIFFFESSIFVPFSLLEIHDFQVSTLTD